MNAGRRPVDGRAGEGARHNDTLRCDSPMGLAAQG